MKVTKNKHSKLKSTDFDNLQFGKLFSDHMFSATFENGKWGNEEIIPYGPLQLDPSTHVFHYGQAVFEGMKAYKDPNGNIQLFRPLDNFSRLNASARRLCMPTISEETFMNGLKALLLLDNGWIPQSDSKSLYIRPFMIGDSTFIRATPSQRFRFMIITSPTSTYYSGKTALKIEESYVRSAEGGTGFAKAAGNYAASFAPTKKAQNEGFTQVIWTDAKTHQYIEESGTMNIMFRIHDTIVTPKLSDSILGGITRDSILTLARHKGIEVQERRVSVNEITEAYKNGSLTEVFGVGTAVTVNPVHTISHRGYTMHFDSYEDDSFATNLKTELLDIQYGKSEDIFNWTVKL